MILNNNFENARTIYDVYILIIDDVYILIVDCTYVPF